MPVVTEGRTRQDPGYSSIRQMDETSVKQSLTLNCDLGQDVQAMSSHVTRQGEHIGRLAKQNGLASYLTIWNHAENADLKSLRENPNVLFPGDDVFIPEKETKWYSAATEKRHKYKLHAKRLRLRVVVQDQTGEPVPDQEAILLMDGALDTVQSGADGMIDKPIPATLERAVLLFQGQDPPFQGPVEMRVGYLDPIDTESGWVARLNNLGYRAGSTEPLPTDGTADPDAQKARQSAVEEFQCDNGLTVDGICGPRTQAKIKDVYGC